MSDAHEHRISKFTTRVSTRCVGGVLVAILLVCTGGLLFLHALDHMSRRNRMRDEIARIKVGETDYLLNPDPEFIDLVMNDPECVERVRGIAFFNPVGTCVVSDARLAPLGQLPSLVNVSLNDTVGTDIFLKHLRGNASVEVVFLYKTYRIAEDLTDEGIECIAQLPNLTELEIWGGLPLHANLRPLEGHPSLKNVGLAYHHDPDLPYEPIPSNHLDILKTLPRLHCLKVRGCAITAEAITTLKTMSKLRRLDIQLSSAHQIDDVRQALPNTKIILP